MEIDYKQLIVYVQHKDQFMNAGFDLVWYDAQWDKSLDMAKKYVLLRLKVPQSDYDAMLPHSYLAYGLEYYTMYEFMDMILVPNAGMMFAGSYGSPTGESMSGGQAEIDKLKGMSDTFKGKAIEFFKMAYPNSYDYMPLQYFAPYNWDGV